MANTVHAWLLLTEESGIIDSYLQMALTLLQSPLVRCAAQQC